MRPYTICLMAASIDGRIDCAMTEVIGGDEYYETLEKIGAAAEINGRKGWTAAFDGIEDQSFGPVKLKLQDVKQFGNGTVEIRYKL